MTTELNFYINKKAFTFDDLIGLDEGNLRTFKEVMAKCLVDPETGKVYEDQDKASAILGKLDLEVTNMAMEKFKVALKATRESAVPLS